MARHSRALVRRYGITLLCFVVAATFLFGPLARISVGRGLSGSTPSKQMIELGRKYSGVAQCGGDGCHGKPGDKSPPSEPGHEQTIWKRKDKHSKAWKTLESDKSKEIVAKLQIADATTSARCLECHSLNAPEDLRAKAFSLKEGNSCGSCHGPDEMWIKPHQEKGWTDKQRAELKTHEALLQKWGLYDTKPYGARAVLCTECHLAIDADMVAAGHPQPTFELAEFDDFLKKHWPRATGYELAKMWLAGQVACLRDAMTQLEKRAMGQDAATLKDAYSQAMAHLQVIRPAAELLGMSGLEGAAAVLEKAAENPASAASTAAEVATMANAGIGNIDRIEMNKQNTLQVLASVANADAMAQRYGMNGMQQQAWAIKWLYQAYAEGEKLPEADRKAVQAAIAKADPRAADNLSAGSFEQALGEIRPLLPK